MGEDYLVAITIVKANAGLLALFQKPVLYVRSATIPDGIKTLKAFAESKGLKMD